MKSLIAVAALLCAPTILSAGVVISVGDTSVPFSTTTQTGSFEVFVTGDVPLPDLIAYQIRLSILPSDSRVKFTAVEMSTTHLYVFPSSSTLDESVFGSGGATFYGSDSIEMGVGLLKDRPGLLKVKYEVLGNTPVGSYNVVVSTSETLLTEPWGNGPGRPLSFTTKDGKIDIVRSIVPEPSTLAMIPAVILGAGYYFWRQRLRARRTNSAGL